jgi:hypothetical protein
VIDQGFTAFYLDTFGNTLDDVKIMRFLREKLGPDIQTFAEHDCDVILLDTGLYENVRFDKRTRRYRVSGPSEIYRWLVPDIATTTAVRVPDRELPEGFESPRAHLFRRRSTPLLADYLVAKHAPEVRALVDKHLDADWQWKPE